MRHGQPGDTLLREQQHGQGIPGTQMIMHNIITIYAVSVGRLLVGLGRGREQDLLLQVVPLSLVHRQEYLQLLGELQGGLGDLGVAVGLGRQHLLPELGRQLADVLVHIAGFQELDVLDVLHLPVPEKVVLVFRQLRHDLQQLFLHLGRWRCEAWVNIPADLYLRDRGFESFRSEPDIGVGFA